MKTADLLPCGQQFLFMDKQSDEKIKEVSPAKIEKTEDFFIDQLAHLLIQQLEIEESKKISVDH